MILQSVTLGDTRRYGSAQDVILYGRLECRGTLLTSLWTLRQARMSMLQGATVYRAGRSLTADHHLTADTPLADANGEKRRPVWCFLVAFMPLHQCRTVSKDG